MHTVTLFSPAKLNLSLAITGRRADGFHELISVTSQLAFGDTLRATRGEDGAGFVLRCDAPGVPVDGTNLVLKAAAAFAAETGWRGGVAFDLEKRTPAGAGLGGGSSNAVAALRALEALSGVTLEAERRVALAARLGSDCALFWHDRPGVRRGRGEFIEALGEAQAARLRGRRVLIFKPHFGVATAWAYQALAARPEWYADAVAEEARLAGWLADGAAPLERLLGNTLERPVFAKWVALPAMLAWLRERHGLEARMSGSGSACFAILPDEADVAAITVTIREGWGAEVFVQATELA
ncbi:MAG: 4-(cytidine 5'-diphospho)-2-C-methyl-D-erythritol kinase [Verrucomicrobia bacterium]|nr:4-(cytidine 5'-diphospho)-2-C-methyl-D-erythritol kinase [Verrucomicrobiota bacterium]